MKRFVALMFISLLLGLVSGPIAMSMETIDIDDQLELIADNIDANDTQIEMEVQSCILPGGLDLKYPITSVETYVEISENFWICTQIDNLIVDSATEHSRLNDLRPDANILAPNTTYMGLTRLDIGESDMDRHFRMTYM